MEMQKQQEEIAELIASGAAVEADAALDEFWRAQKTPGAAAFVISCYEKLRDRLSLASYRLAILRSFTVEPAVPLLRAAAFVNGFDLSVHTGDFNAYPQEVLDVDSSLYQFKPDVAILAVQTRDIAPELWRDFADLESGDGMRAAERIANDFRGWIQAFRKHSNAYLVVHNLEQPAIPSEGLLDAQSANGQSAAIRRVNEKLRAITQEIRGTYLLDYDALTARFGRFAWHDERKWLTVRLPIAASQLIHLADEWLRLIRPLSGKLAKVLVVDLDNTLWGGVIGEDGMDGIQLGLEYPGAAYQALQRAILDLYHRGILLAVCSKNNPDDAMAALEKHPGMLLRPQHFAAMRINWADKPQNLREIAEELNVGLDSLALLDDNPVERRHVRLNLSEVAVIELPNNSMDYARALREDPVFERVSLSAEDRERSKYYNVQRERVQLEQICGSREDFLRNLQQEARIARVSSATLPRVAQLTQKTNQFNLTTRRYSEQDIALMGARPECDVLSIRVKDRFADNGLVGVAITRDKDGACELDTFLLSCRVIGRDVETALLSYLAARARTRGCHALQGWFFPTKKNAPAKDFYSAHGFEVVEQNEKGSLWRLDLANSGVHPPEWIKVVAVEEEGQ